MIKTLEQDIIKCFEKRNIEVLSLNIDVKYGEYKIKVKYPENKN